MLLTMSRLAWVAAAAGHVWSYSLKLRLSPRRAFALFLDCVWSGARPNEALIWRQLFPKSGRHPLPGRAAARLLSQIGNPDGHILLFDKQATGDFLASHGLRVPETRGLIRANSGRDIVLSLDQPLWSLPAQLFVKPRHGSAARNAVAIDVLGPDAYRIDGNAPCQFPFLRDHIATKLQDDLLVQTRLQAATSISDLAFNSAAPVLRLTAARYPGERPFLHSALLSIAVPNENPRNFLRGHMWVPIDAKTGAMAHAIWFADPDKIYSKLPWNGAALSGRCLPGLGDAVKMAMQATTLLPALALVNWDLILTEDGPVFLEGNTSGNWILTNLSATVPGLETTALAPLLAKWIGSPC